MEKKLLVLGFFIFISAYSILYIGLNVGLNKFFYWISIGLGVTGILQIVLGLIVYVIKREKISK